MIEVYVEHKDLSPIGTTKDVLYLGYWESFFVYDHFVDNETGEYGEIWIPTKCVFNNYNPI